MVNAAFEPSFEKIFRKLDSSVKEMVKKHIRKIIDFPEIGKPMRHNRKGIREVYLSPYRLSYAYLKEEDIVVFLDLYHKDEQ